MSLDSFQEARTGLNGDDMLRFQPDDHELILHHLAPKIRGEICDHPHITDFDIYSVEPHQLPERSKMRDDRMHYFFYLLRYKSKTNTNCVRRIQNGYWKLTGKARCIKDPVSEKDIGIKRILVFHTLKDEKTNWIMHQYQTLGESMLVLAKIWSQNHRKRKRESAYSTISTHNIPIFSEDVVLPSGNDQPNALEYQSLVAYVHLLAAMNEYLLNYVKVLEGIIRRMQANSHESLLTHGMEIVSPNGLFLDNGHQQDQYPVIPDYQYQGNEMQVYSPNTNMEIVSPYDLCASNGHGNDQYLKTPENQNQVTYVSMGVAIDEAPCGLRLDLDSTVRDVTVTDHVHDQYTVLDSRNQGIPMQVQPSSCSLFDKDQHSNTCIILKEISIVFTILNVFCNEVI